ncbi:hypothetical protein QVD17_01978 [Tagetes erecta]|uniref:MINDY deubiquitinase domain-containing protein n=1 Tax=Tagetes erecta TaxID=13708 RepID=A0AAD8P1Z6_TARER|nr:hypothetical protein QVD17_01978 [Tagetes erecta]
MCSIRSFGYTIVSEELGGLTALDPESDIPSTRADIEEGMIKSFLPNSSNQLTPHGLSCLQNEIAEGEVSVLYKNSQFIPMLKFMGRLYLLATNKSLIPQSDFVWGLLVDGNTVYASLDFEAIQSGQKNSRSTSAGSNSKLNSKLKFSDVQLVDQLRTNKTLEKLAEEFKVSRSTIERRIYKLGGRDKALNSVSASAGLPLTSVTQVSTAEKRTPRKLLKFRAHSITGQVVIVEFKHCEASLDHLLKRIASELKVDPGSFELKYIDDDYEVDLRTEEAMACCKRSMANTNLAVLIIVFLDDKKTK